jgi:hypothetical protein
MFTKIKEFLFGKPAEVAAPYKIEAPAPTEHVRVETPAPTEHVRVETPAPTEHVRVETPEPVKCGCGRSQSGLCVGLHKLSAEEWSTHNDNPAKVKKAPARTKRAPAVKQQVEKKPAPVKTAKPKAAAMTKSTKPKQ